MRWGRRWGNPYGEDLITNVRLTDLQEDPPATLAQWDDEGSVLYHVYADGKYYQTISVPEIVIQFQNSGRHWVEVLIAGQGNLNQEPGDFVSEIPGARVKLTWTASVSADLAYYKIYWDQGLGGGLSYLDRTKQNETEWISQELADGDYVFRVDGVDNAGNQVTSGATVTVTIDRYPNPPSSLVLDNYDDGTDTADFSFTPSTTPTISGYRVYHNGGSGEIDYGTVIATLGSGANDFSLSGIGVGNWQVGLRAYRTSFEEDNVDVVASFDVDTVTEELLEAPPNIPNALAAIPAANGMFTLKCTYECFDEQSKATQVNFYANDGAGTVDYSSILVSASVPSHTQGDLLTFEITATSPSLNDGDTYIFGAKAATTSGRESDAATEATAVADATAPSDISGLTGTAVNYEE